LFGRGKDPEAETAKESQPASHTYQLRQAYRYHVSIRREIDSFDDAYAAANGLKRGEQQVMNLTRTDPILRQKIVDFMAGVAFAQEANWEEVGEHIYLVAPSSAFVEQTPQSGTVPVRSGGAFFNN
jgi:cell division inhibitor SepF